MLSCNKGSENKRRDEKKETATVENKRLDGIQNKYKLVRVN